MDLEIIIPREVRKRKTNAFDITYMWSPKDGTREHIHDTGTDLQREQTCGCRGGGNNRQLGLGRCKQHIGWISNNVSLCSASNYIHYFPGGSEIKASASNTGDLGSIPGSGRSPGEGNGNPLQYSCLENAMDRGAWWVTFMV